MGSSVDSSFDIFWEFHHFFLLLHAVISLAVPLKYSSLILYVDSSVTSSVKLFSVIYNYFEVRHHSSTFRIDFAHSSGNVFVIFVAISKYSYIECCSNFFGNFSRVFFKFLWNCRSPRAPKLPNFLCSFFLIPSKIFLAIQSVFPFWNYFGNS